MSKLTESSNREETLAAIDADEIKSFNDLPEQYKNAEIAQYWIEKYKREKTQGARVLSAFFFYRDVPLNCMTDDFYRVAAACGCPVLRDIKPDQTAIYRELVYLNLDFSHCSMEHIDPAFRDEELLEYVFSRYVSQCQLWAYSYDWVIDVMSDDLFDRCCQASFIFALEAPAHRIKGDIGRFLDLREFNPAVIFRLRSKRRFDLIAAKIGVADDPWPFPDKYWVIQPRSKSHLVELLEDAEPETLDETIYMSCMFLECIEKVVSLMASRRLKRLLLEMYPLEALKPFMKSDVGLRGLLLEEAMGL